MDAANSLPHAQLASPARARSRGMRIRHALAGLQAGVIGAALMVGWLMLASLWMRRPFWAVPNLFATLFYGPAAYHGFFLRATFAGFAFVLAVYGALGAVWGVLWQEREHSFLRLTGALTGLGVYAIFFHWIWPHASPLISLYAPERQMQVAHMLWGIMLASSPRFSRNIASAVGSSGEAGPGEFRSGEVIL